MHPAHQPGTNLTLRRLQRVAPHSSRAIATSVQAETKSVQAETWLRIAVRTLLAEQAGPSVSWPWEARVVRLSGHFCAFCRSASGDPFWRSHPVTERDPDRRGHSLARTMDNRTGGTKSDGSGCGDTALTKNRAAVTQRSNLLRTGASSPAQQRRSEKAL